MRGMAHWPAIELMLMIGLLLGRVRPCRRPISRVRTIGAKKLTSNVLVQWSSSATVMRNVFVTGTGVVHEYVDRTRFRGEFDDGGPVGQVSGERFCVAAGVVDGIYDPGGGTRCLVRRRSAMLRSCPPALLRCVHRCRG